MSETAKLQRQMEDGGIVVDRVGQRGECQAVRVNDEKATAWVAGMDDAALLRLCKTASATNKSLVYDHQQIEAENNRIHREWMEIAETLRRRFAGASKEARSAIGDLYAERLKAGGADYWAKHDRQQIIISGLFVLQAERKRRGI